MWHGTCLDIMHASKSDFKHLNELLYFAMNIPKMAISLMQIFSHLPRIAVHKINTFLHFDKQPDLKSLALRVARACRFRAPERSSSLKIARAASIPKQSSFHKPCPTLLLLTRNSLKSDHVQFPLAGFELLVSCLRRHLAADLKSTYFQFILHAKLF